MALPICGFQLFVAAGQGWCCSAQPPVYLRQLPRTLTEELQQRGSAGWWEGHGWASGRHPPAAAAARWWEQHPSQHPAPAAVGASIQAKPASSHHRLHKTFVEISTESSLSDQAVQLYGKQQDMKSNIEAYISPNQKRPPTIPLHLLKTY